MVGHTYRPSPGFRFPDGHRFAFTIFDDTDVGTLDSVRPVYDLLTSLGMRTTKTVWPLQYRATSDFSGSHTLEHADYAEFMRELAKRGFEIAYHGATMESSTRDDAMRAFQRFWSTFGFFPRSYASHATNRDNLYWGAHRFGSRVTRLLYRLLSSEEPDRYRGHVQGSPYFWGDMSVRHIDYVRGFTFKDIDIWSVTPHACYEDPRTPWVKFWFGSSDADNVEEFIELLSDENQDRLEQRGGLCILSTHLGKGFVIDGRVEPRVEQLLRKLARRPGWFAPASDILDHLRLSGAIREIRPLQRLKLELQWFAHAWSRRSRRRSYEKSELPYLAESIERDRLAGNLVLDQEERAVG